MTMSDSLLTETGRIKLQVARLAADARRLCAQPGGTPAWPADAVAEAEELADVLAEAAARAEKLYAATPPPWKVAEEASRG